MVSIQPDGEVGTLVSAYHLSAAEIELAAMAPGAVMGPDIVPVKVLK